MIISFLTIIALYHIFVTIGIFWWWYTHLISNIAALRDLIRFIPIVIIACRNRRHTRAWLQQHKRLIISGLGVIIRSILISLYNKQEVYNIAVGIKYGLMYLPILRSAIYLWSMIKIDTKKRTKTIFRWLNIIVILGLIRQIAKYIRPDIFMHIGYGPIGDFVFGQNPPIYYRTWPGWDPRLQWLFAGPNNYGYFLVVLLPFVRSIYTNKQKWSLGVLRILSIILTISRTAFIGMCIVFIVLYRSQIKKNKYILYSIIVAILGVIGLMSIRKGGSTMQHIQQKRQSIHIAIQNPGWLWLGTSWPAIHHEGSILPENYYIQLIIDIGTIGFLIRWRHISQLLQLIKKWQKDIHIRTLSIWFFALLIMGLFLHVFEDSMVNYIFFIIRWIYIGLVNNKNIDKMSS